jgi:hypothetical protein
VLDETVSFSNETSVDLIELDDALKQLAILDAQQSRIVELRFFGGLTIEETAALCNSLLPPSNANGLWPRHGCTRVLSDSRHHRPSTYVIRSLAQS